MFRSCPMSYYQIVMPRESAWPIMNALGHLAKVEIIDFDSEQPMINRPFANYVKRCDDLLLKIQQIHKEVVKLRLDSKYFKGQFDQQTNEHSHTYLDKVEEDINRKLSSFLEHQKHHEQLIEQSQYMGHHQQVLHETLKYVGNLLFQNASSGDQLKFDYMVGVVLTSELAQQCIRRVVFRITKGNAALQIADIPSRSFAGVMEKQQSIYILIYPNSGSYMAGKLHRLCDAMSVNKFQLPTTQQEYQNKLIDLSRKQDEISHVYNYYKSRQQLLTLTHTQLCTSLNDLLIPIQGVSLIEQYRMFLIKERELYIQLNKLRMQGHLFIGELWVPSLDIPSLESALRTVKQSNAHHPGGQLALKQPPPNITIPTYFHLNDFTAPFQLIINTYGVPRYQEINPALLTCITFPFLFGVMFGDIGHGTALFSFGVYLCFNHTPDFHPYRYLIALMGFFSIYAGFIYNDFVGMALNLFGSCYSDNGVLLEQKKSDCNYPFGIDPAWQSTLEFGDSVKMKFSVIIALLHMCLGIVMQGMNQIHKQDYLGFTCKFIPQIIFMLCIFGYMDFLIVYKWLVQFTPTTAPSIINTIIAMVLELGKVDGLYMWEGTSQETIQSTLVAIAIITIPWMWLPRILVACVESQPKQSLDYGQLDEEPSVEIQMQELHYHQHTTEIMTQSPPESALLDTQIPSHNNQHGNKDEFTEIVVHETIETIEFVLGSVSNTASYLRLWALSLAHSQLAEVFYQLILAESVEDGQTLGMIVAFPSWAMFTFGVLLCMDTMECFLHSLRLHWVEFQSKFYKGDGVQFQVYSFKSCIQN